MIRPERRQTPVGVDISVGRSAGYELSSSGLRSAELEAAVQAGKAGPRLGNRERPSLRQEEDDIVSRCSTPSLHDLVPNEI